MDRQNCIIEYLDETLITNKDLLLKVDSESITRRYRIVD